MPAERDHGQEHPAQLSDAGDHVTDTGALEEVDEEAETDTRSDHAAPWTAATVSLHNQRSWRRYRFRCRWPSFYWPAGSSLASWATGSSVLSGALRLRRRPRLQHPVHRHARHADDDPGHGDRRSWHRRRPRGRGLPGGRRDAIGAGLGAAAVTSWPRGAIRTSGSMLGACLVGALLALAVRRHVLITVTSFGGAWTALVGRDGALRVTRQRWLPRGVTSIASRRSGTPDNLPVFIVGWVILGAG